jgi:hypothetical protein
VADDLSDDRYTVRGVPKAFREKAAKAAGRRKIPVGAWLCQAIDREVEAERQPLDLIRPGSVADKSSDPSDIASDAVARLALVERAIAAAVAGGPIACCVKASHSRCRAS